MNNQDIINDFIISLHKELQKRGVMLELLDGDDAPEVILADSIKMHIERIHDLYGDWF